MIEFARSLVDGELADLDVIQNFSDAMTVDGEKATVYLATGIADASRIKSPHLTLPDHSFRRTPQGRGRVILIKSMQVFTGALTQETKAVDFAEAIKHFDD